MLLHELLPYKDHALPPSQLAPRLGYTAMTVGRAWLDLTARQETGRRVDPRDIRKHRNDGLPLAQVLAPWLRLPESAQTWLASSRRWRRSACPLRDLGLGALRLDDVLDPLRVVYGLRCRQRSS